MTRTTLDLDPDVLRRLKRLRAEQGKPLGAIASELLTRQLAEAPVDPGPLAWTTARMGSAKVDLEDPDAVSEALEG